MHRVQILFLAPRVLIQEAVAPREAIRAELSLEMIDARAIRDRISRRRQKFEPDRVLPQPAQPEHPLQRNGENAAPFAILRGKATT